MSWVSFSPFNNEYLVVNIKRGGGQNHVWTPLNQNQGSLDPADQSVQTFRFAEPVAARSSSAAFDVISTNTELDVNELIVYRGLGDEHLVSKVIGVLTEQPRSRHRCRLHKQPTVSSGVSMGTGLIRISVAMTHWVTLYSGSSIRVSAISCGIKIICF